MDLTYYDEEIKAVVKDVVEQIKEKENVLTEAPVEEQRGESGFQRIRR